VTSISVLCDEPPDENARPETVDRQWGKNAIARVSESCPLPEAVRGLECGLRSKR